MEQQFTAQDFQGLAAAHERIQGLKKFVIERGVTHYRMQGKDLNLRYDDGFGVQVTDYALFDTDKPDITFTQEDGREGRRVATYTVPRDFVFAETRTEQEAKWEQYMTLKAELGQ